MLPLDEPIHITLPGSPTDPREALTIHGVVVHRTPPLHPDDLDVVDGIPVTSVARTLIDCAEMSTRAELHAMFVRARELGVLDEHALRASRARVEWRPWLELFDKVASEFCDLGH